MQNFRKLAQLEMPINREELRTNCKASNEDDHPYILKTKSWAKNHKFDTVITFEPHEISTRSKRRFVHLGEVIT